MLRRTLPATLAALGMATTLLACGDDAPKTAADVTITLPAAPTAAAPSATTGVTGRQAESDERPEAAVSTVTAPPRKPAAPPTTTTPNAAGGTQVASSSGPDAPVVCLRRAQLSRPRKRGAGVWGANDRGSGRPVLVDGPYKTAKEAKESAASLGAVSFAEGGGLYVASASLRSKLGDAVSTVAKCLGARS